MNRSGKRHGNRRRAFTAAAVGAALLGLTTAGLYGETAQASTVGGGLYSTLSGIYGSTQSGSSGTTSGTSSSGSLTMGQLLGGSSTSSGTSYGSSYSGGTTGGTAARGGTSEVNGKRVINYYPLYNTQRQQQVNIQQQVQQQVKQYYDVSGNAYYNYVNGSGQADVSGNSKTAMSNTIDQWTQAITPDIAALESDPVGPIVNTVSLAESYHENYQIYEERFSDLYAIYTNIANGSISNRPAIFDVPNGVSVRLTRDGRNVGFSNKGQIKDEGTYVAQFYVTQDGSEELPGWQQTIERARFVFRIQYTAGLDGQPLVLAEEPSELSSFADLVQGESEVLLPGDTEEPEPVQEEPAPAETQEPQEEQPAPGIVSATNGLSTAYDSSTGYYRISLLTGDSFSTNIPDGMVTNEAVLFMGSENMRFEIYRSGELVEYTPGEFIKESGNYIAIPVIDNLDYESYYRMNKPMMRFRIVGGQVNDLGTITAPESLKITAVRLGGEDITAQSVLTDKVAKLSEDGSYEVEFTGDGGTTSVVINRDTEPPQVKVTEEPNSARIDYLSEDIESATLYRGNELVSDGQLQTVVTDTGRYRLVVRDTAGNETTREFAVAFRINGFAILAIVAVMGLIGALIIFLNKVKTSVKVR